VISHFRFIFLKLFFILLINSRWILNTFSIVFHLLPQTFFCLRFRILSFHAHQYLNWSLNIVNYRKRIYFSEFFPLFAHSLFIVCIDLKINLNILLTSSLDRTLTERYKSIRASSSVSSMGIDCVYELNDYNKRSFRLGKFPFPSDSRARLAVMENCLDI